MRRPIFRGLAVLLKVHRFFGFGRIYAGETIGKYRVRDVSEKKMLCISPGGDYIEERDFRRYSLDYGAGDYSFIYQTRGTALFNLWGNFMTRFDIKNSYLGQPIYGRRKNLAVILEK